MVEGNVINSIRIDDVVITPSGILITEGVRYYRRSYETQRTRDPVDIGDVIPVNVHVNTSRKYLGDTMSVSIVVLPYLGGLPVLDELIRN